MENIIALLKDAKRNIELACNTESPEAHQCFLDCAAIYIDGAIQIANNHIKADLAPSDFARESRTVGYK